MKPIICKIDGCERDLRLVKGMCPMHYTRQRRGNTNLSPEPTHQHKIEEGSICSLKDCDKLERSVGLCIGHYESNKAMKARIEVRERIEYEAEQLKYAVLCGVFLLKSKNMSLRTAVEAAALHSGYKSIEGLRNAIKAEFPDDYFVKKRNKRWKTNPKDRK